MRIPSPLVLALLALCACNAQTPLQPTVAGVSQSQSARPDRARNERLFVSESSTGQIYLYDVPALKLVTILQGFGRPQGECADNLGDVWVTDGMRDRIDKLDYAGKTLSHLSDTSGSPYSCAWDPKTGSLAVTNYSSKSGAGSLLVYRNAVGRARIYRNPSQFYYYFAGYDPSGNLYFDGETRQNKFVLSELPLRAYYAHTIGITRGKIYIPGTVQWDSSSHYLDIGDQLCGGVSTSCLYEVEIARSKASLIDRISLRNYRGSKVCDVIQIAIANGDAYGSDNDYCSSASTATYDWSLPQGNPRTYVKKGAATPFGAAIAIDRTP